VEGTLVRATPCMLLRTADGRTIALAGTRPGRAFRPGQAVVVMGVEQKRNQRPYGMPHMPRMPISTALVGTPSCW
jgi:hypothetical protein